MIFNLVKYLKNNLTTETIFANARLKIDSAVQIPDRVVLVNESGGGDTPHFRYETPTYQVLCRDIDPVKCRELAYSVYNLLHSKFALILPSVTVNSTVYPSKTVAQSKALNKPQSIGYDDNGRAEYSTNFVFDYHEY